MSLNNLIKMKNVRHVTLQRSLTGIFHSCCVKWKYENKRLIDYNTSNLEEKLKFYSLESLD